MSTQPSNEAKKLALKLAAEAGKEAARGGHPQPATVMDLFYKKYLELYKEQLQ